MDAGSGDFNNLRLQFCTELYVEFNDGRDLELWKNNFQFAVIPHLKELWFRRGVNFCINTVFPLLRLNEKNEKAFTSTSLERISAFIAEDHPILYLACQIAKVNNVWINDLNDPTEYISEYFPNH